MSPKETIILPYGYSMHTPVSIVTVATPQNFVLLSHLTNTVPPGRKTGRGLNSHLNLILPPNSTLPFDVLMFI